jgi:hypothetical protein
MNAMRHLLVLVLGAAFLGNCAGCGKGCGEEDKEAAWDVDAWPAPDLKPEPTADIASQADADGSATDLGREPDLPRVDLLDLQEPDIPVCVSQCQEGDAECKYNFTGERRCISETVGGVTCWVWDKITQCKEGTVCVEELGCTCKYGACDGPEDVEGCLGYPMGKNDYWICEDGCCVPVTCRSATGGTARTASTSRPARSFPAPTDRRRAPS